MNSNVALSIVVPIYNEEESLPFLVNQLLEVLQPMEETFELVLVNDQNYLEFFYVKTMDRQQRWQQDLIFHLER